MGQNRRIWKEFTGWSSLEGHWLRRKHFTAQCLAHIAGRIHAAEAEHPGELVLAVEAVSPAHERDPAVRALEVFGRLRVWDTPHNTGVLLYIALDRHSIEIIADRGVGVPGQAWTDICAQLTQRFQAGDFIPGLLAAIDAIETLLKMYCSPLPPGETNRNDLPDTPVLL